LKPIRKNSGLKRIREGLRSIFGGSANICKLGMKNEAAFESDLRLLQDQLAVARSEQSTEILGTQKALTLFKGVPTFIAKATDEERRAVLLEVFDAIHLTPHQVLAIRPAAAYAELLKGVRERLVPVSTTADKEVRARPMTRSRLIF